MAAEKVTDRNEKGARERGGRDRGGREGGRDGGEKSQYGARCFH